MKAISLKERCEHCGTDRPVCDIHASVLLPSGGMRLYLYCQACAHRWWIER